MLDLDPENGSQSSSGAQKTAFGSSGVWKMPKGTKPERTRLERGQAENQKADKRKTRKGDKRNTRTGTSGKPERGQAENQKGGQDQKGDKRKSRKGTMLLGFTTIFLVYLGFSRGFPLSLKLLYHPAHCLCDTLGHNGIKTNLIQYIVYSI